MKMKPMTNMESRSYLLSIESGSLVLRGFAGRVIVVNIGTERFTVIRSITEIEAMLAQLKEELYEQALLETVRIEKEAVDVTPHD